MSAHDRLEPIETEAHLCICLTPIGKVLLMKWYKRGMPSFGRAVFLIAWTRGGAVLISAWSVVPVGASLLIRVNNDLSKTRRVSLDVLYEHQCSRRKCRRVSLAIRWVGSSVLSGVIVKGGVGTSAHGRQEDRDGRVRRTPCSPCGADMDPSK